MEQIAEGTRPDFGKLEVVAFESRRAQEMATLISTYGSIPIVAPSLSGPPRNYGVASRAAMRPPGKARRARISGIFDRGATPPGGMQRRLNAAVITRRTTKGGSSRGQPHRVRLAQKLFAGELDAVIFTTGIGTETLIDLLESRYPRAQIAQALAALVIVARGPKPVKVLRELQVPITVAVSEPYRWREILRELGCRSASKEAVKSPPLSTRRSARGIGSRPSLAVVQ